MKKYLIGNDSEIENHLYDTLEDAVEGLEGWWEPETFIIYEVTNTYSVGETSVRTPVLNILKESH